MEDRPREQGETAIHVWLITGIAALSAVPVVYAVLRAYSALITGEAAPLSVGPSAHIAMFWRVNLSVYVGVACAPLMFRVIREDAGRAVRWAERGVYAAGAVIALQGLLLP